MSDQPIAKYRNGGNLCTVWPHKVALTVIGIGSTHPIETIRDVRIKNGLFNSRLCLELRDGTSSMSVIIWKKDAGDCAKTILNAIQQYEALQGEGTLVRCTYLGGSGVDLKDGCIYSIVFSANSVQIISDATSIAIPLSKLKELKLTGPGRVQTSADVIGGGFGVEGAALGIAAAALINRLTQQTTTNTFLYLRTPDQEGFFHTNEATPDDLRIKLSSIFLLIKSNENSGPQTDITSQLEKLVKLRDQGDLNAEQFETAKKKILG